MGVWVAAEVVGGNHRGGRAGDSISSIIGRLRPIHPSDRTHASTDPPGRHTYTHTHAHVPMMVSRGMPSFSSGVRSDAMVRCRLPSLVLSPPPRRLPAPPRRNATLVPWFWKGTKKSKAAESPRESSRAGCRNHPFPAAPSFASPTPRPCLLRRLKPLSPAAAAAPSSPPSVQPGRGTTLVPGAPLASPTPSCVSRVGVSVGCVVSGGRVDRGAPNPWVCII